MQHEATRTVLILSTLNFFRLFELTSTSPMQPPAVRRPISVSDDTRQMRFWNGERIMARCTGLPRP